MSPIGWSLCQVGEADDMIQMGYAIWTNDRPNVGRGGASIYYCERAKELGFMNTEFSIMRLNF